MKPEGSAPHGWRVVRGAVLGVVMIAVVVLIMMWLMGHFHPKVETAAAATGTPVGRPVGDTPLVEVRTLTRPREETAVGTIRPDHGTSIASKLLATVVEVNIKAGQPVRKGDVLIRLDDADLKARLGQAEAAVSAATANRDRAKIDFDRVEQLLRQNAATKTEFDQASTTLRAAEAELNRADEALKEAQTILGYATISSPLDGRVIDKQVDVGDTVEMGRVLVTLFARMQLVASVRESLTNRLRVGQTIGVQIDAVGHPCEGTISEIVPEAESASRTFAVKVTGPCPPGVYPGMFGRLIIPLEDEEVLVVPRAAVRRVGQVDIVEVAEGDRLCRRAVQLGRTLGDDCEVLSGLRAGERVALSETPTPVVGRS